MRKDYGKLLSEHKTSLFWLFKRRAAFYIVALFLFSFGIVGFIVAPYNFTENIDLYAALFAVGVIFLLLSIKYTKSFKASIHERGFIFTYGFTKKRISMGFNELAEVYWQEDAKGEEYEHSLIIGNIVARLIINLFVGFSHRIHGITLLKQNGNAIDLKPSRNNDYRQFIMELDLALQEWCASTGQRMSKEAEMTIHAWENKAVRDNKTNKKLNYIIVIATGVFLLLGLIVIVQDRMAEPGFIYSPAYNNNTAISISGYRRREGSELHIPSHIDGLPVTTIMIDAFSESGLTSVTLPYGVTTIETSAFRDNQLTYIIIPDSVTQIGRYAFWGNQITDVIIPYHTALSVNAFDRDVVVIRTDEP